MIVMLIGSFLSILLNTNIKRNDGTTVNWKSTLSSNWKTDFTEVFKLLGNSTMVVLTPLFFSSNFFYSYQFNAVNAHLFNLRTRAFNNSIYWLAQMIGSYVIAKLVLDSMRWKRRKRALIGWIVVFFCAELVWLYGFFVQQPFERTDIPSEIDISGGLKYATPAILFFFYGAIDAIIQLFVYWLMGAQTNDPILLSRFSGYYKSIQSLGASVAWYLDAHDTPYMTQLIVNWCLTSVSLIFAFFPVLRVKDFSETTEQINSKSSDNMNEEQTSNEQQSSSVPIGAVGLDD
jgi:hypothetical protein